MGRVPVPFCLGVLEHPMFRPVDEEAKIIQVVMSFPEGFRLLWPNVVYGLSRTSVAMLID